MANFNYLDFIKIPNSGDTKLYIKNINGSIVWTISPFKVESTLIQNNNIKINFYNTDSILIDFNNITESKKAIITLQRYLTELRNKVPTEIDKATQLYIDAAVARGLPGSTGPQGNVGPMGSIGPIGLTGPQGPSIIGPQGVQGPIGPQGVQGNYGPVSPVGLIWQGRWISGSGYVVDDTVAYASASWFCYATVSVSTVAPDVDSSHWALLAAQGAPGQMGPQGNQGPIGYIGATGSQGNQGAAGPQGSQGPSSLSYYTQSSFSGVTSSHVIHNYGEYPVVQVLDSTGSVIIPESIINNTVNDLTVYFSIITTGIILLTVGNIGQISKMPNIPYFNNDAAAIVGGLTTSQLYKTTISGITSLCIVP